MAKQIKVYEALATTLGRRDEEPNIELAQRIAAANDEAAVKDLAELLQGKDKKTKSDCIKTLYELGAIKPGLIKSYDGLFLDLLKSKDNRMVWGALTALHCISSEVPERIYESLHEILDVADKGSVISKDHAMGILVTLCGQKAYREEMIALLLERLQAAADNQFAMYAEQIAPVMAPKHMQLFLQILNARIVTLPKESQQKRIGKLLRKLTKQ